MQSCEVARGRGAGVVLAHEQQHVAEAAARARVVRVELDAALERPVRRLARLLAVLRHLDHPNPEPRRAHLGVLLDGRAQRRERLVPLLLLVERLALVEARLRRCARDGNKAGVST